MSDQQAHAVREALGDLRLQGVIARIRIRTGEEHLAEVRIRTAGLKIARPGLGLVGEQVQGSEVRSLGPDVVHIHRPVLGQLRLQSKAPLLHVRRLVVGRDVQRNELLGEVRNPPAGVKDVGRSGRGQCLGGSDEELGR